MLPNVMGARYVSNTGGQDNPYQRQARIRQIMSQLSRPAQPIIYKVGVPGGYRFRLPIK